MSAHRGLRYPHPCPSHKQKMQPSSRCKMMLLGSSPMSLPHSPRDRSELTWHLGGGGGSRWERKRGAQSLTCDPPSPVPLATPQQQTYLCTSPECQCYVSHTPIPCLFRTLAEIADAHAHAHAPRYACCTHAKDTSMPARADNELHVTTVTCVSWGTCVFHMSLH